MKKILRTADEAPGNGTPAPSQPTAEPPVTAKIVEGGKTERELLLERQNAKLTAAIKKTSSIKRQTEEEAARIIRENEKLRAAAQATKEKFSWMGYTNS